MNNDSVPQFEIVYPAFRMHTQTFDNALRNISEADALKRIDGKTNHIIWMAGNLVNCRYWMANVLGIPDADPNEELFKEAKALDESKKYPTLEFLRNEWHSISKKLYERLQTVTNAELQEPYSFGMGVDFIKENKLNMIGMGIDRVSYLFGQIGLMRKILGYPGMSYEINKDILY